MLQFLNSNNLSVQYSKAFNILYYVYKGKRHIYTKNGVCTLFFL